jgi:hypothetical protein
MANKYKTSTTITRHQNPETRVWEEVETKKVHKITIKPDDEFYMVYIKYMSPYYEIKYADDIKLLGKLCEWAEFEKGTVYLTSGRRKEVTETLGVHNSNISKSLNRLKELKLIAGSDGEFEINPVVFWKGSKASRMEIMRKEGVQTIFNFSLEQDIKPNTGLKPSQSFD